MTPPPLEISVAFAIVGAGVMTLIGMLTGTWKYAEMRRSPVAKAPLYVDIAHRAALMYGSSMAVLALLAWLSPWSQMLESAAVLLNFLFFFIATMTYVKLGIQRETQTQYRARNFTTGLGTWLLILAEVGGTSVLVCGAIAGLRMLLAT